MLYRPDDRLHLLRRLRVLEVDPFFTTGENGGMRSVAAEDMGFVLPPSPAPSPSRLLLCWLRDVCLDCTEVPPSRQLEWVETLLDAHMANRDYHRRSLVHKTSQESAALLVPDAGAAGDDNDDERSYRNVVQRVVLRGIAWKTHISRVGFRLMKYIQSLVGVGLTVLDLRISLKQTPISILERCDFNEDNLLCLILKEWQSYSRRRSRRDEASDVRSSSVSASPPPPLRRLYLRVNSLVSQATLNHFSQLEELDVTNARNVESVSFCAASLRALYANDCFRLRDAGLCQASRLEVLHVRNCQHVTTVRPFVETLTDLDISGDCGINSLQGLRLLQVLRLTGESRVPQVGREIISGLRELLLTGSPCCISDVVLSSATSLVRLEAPFNRIITTVRPFATTLRVLDASSSISGLGDGGLSCATSLVALDATDNAKICSCAPFHRTLLDLSAGYSCGIRSYPWFSSSSSSSATTSDDVVRHSGLRLIRLNASGNPKIESLDSSVNTLRHLVASSKSGITNASLRRVTQLVTLDCSNQRGITSIRPFVGTLRELRAAGLKCGLGGSDVRTAMQRFEKQHNGNRRTEASVGYVTQEADKQHQLPRQRTAPLRVVHLQSCGCWNPNFNPVTHLNCVSIMPSDETTSDPANDKLAASFSSFSSSSHRTAWDFDRIAEGIFVKREDAVMDVNDGFLLPALDDGESVADSEQNQKKERTSCEVC